MTLAESVTARRKLQALKAEDRTETRMFEIVSQVRAVEECGRTATSPMKAERSRQARRTAAAAAPSSGTGMAATRTAIEVPSPLAPTRPGIIEPFTDVEDL